MHTQEELFGSPDSPVPADMREAILARATRLRARKGQLLISAGFQSSDVYLVVSGSVQVSLVSSEGRETIIRDIGENSIFGEFAALDGRMRSSNVTASTDCQLAMMTGSAFLELVGSEPGVGLWLSRHLTTQIRFLTSRVFELSNMNVGNRLHCELLRLAIKAGVANDAAVIEGAPTHADFASRIGTNREAVTRELGMLAEEGVVSQSGRRLEILSVDKLGLMIRQLPHFI